jgi:hypothetical protein
MVPGACIRHAHVRLDACNIEVVAAKALKKRKRREETVGRLLVLPLLVKADANLHQRAVGLHVSHAELSLKDRVRALIVLSRLLKPILREQPVCGVAVCLGHFQMVGSENVPDEEKIALIYQLGSLEEPKKLRLAS